MHYSGYHRTFGIGALLLVTLVLAHVGLFPVERDSAIALSLCSLSLLFYQLIAARWRITAQNGRTRTLADLVLLLFFVTVISWHTGKAASPFAPLTYLLLMTGSLTQSKRVSHLLAALAIGLYIILSLSEAPLTQTLAARLPVLLSFLLITRLGVILAQEAKEARREVERLSLTDDLTGLHNMRSFKALATQQEKMAKRYGKPFAVCMLDTDNLKQVNDRYGHLAGTALIKWTARVIESNIRECDVAARFGGDEFIILFGDHDKRQIFQAVHRIVQAMAATPLDFEGAEISCTVSAGIASFPEDADNLKGVIARADQAVYRSKHRGKNRACIYTDCSDEEPAPPQSVAGGSVAQWDVGVMPVENPAAGAAGASGS